MWPFDRPAWRRGLERLGALLGGSRNAEPLLHFAPEQWRGLCETLHDKTAGRHESGAFLLGERRGRHRTVRAVVFYDELDAAAYASGVCILRASAFAQLWARCSALGLEVVADIHVHPGGAWQSASDRENPMIAQKGHLALILPDFARGGISLGAIGFHEYRGAHQWRGLGGSRIRRHLKIGVYP